MKSQWKIDEKLISDNLVMFKINYTLKYHSFKVNRLR